MFKFRIYCLVFLLALSLPVSAGTEDEGMALTCPEQYFAVSWDDAWWGDAAAVYWPALFPENPPFRYACIYLGSFDQEFGFYLDGDTLHWALSAGAQSRQMLSRKPVVDLQTAPVARGASLLVFLWDPLVRSLLHGWDCFLEENPFHVLGRGEDKRHVPGFRDGVGRAAAGMESLVNPWLYSRLYIERGSRTLSPALADSLRGTWDEAVARRAFPMRAYRELLQRFDGNYCYFRGGSGPVAEDLCCSKGKMRLSMIVLACGLIDIMMMDDLNPETERWLMEQCAAVRRNAFEVGDGAPPMASDAWARDFSDRYAEYLMKMQAGDGGRGNGGNKAGAVPASPELEEKAEPVKPEPDEKAFVRGFRERFFKPLEENPLWKDLFPKGSEGKAAALWFGEKGVSGIYVDATRMGMAFARNTHPELLYCNYFFDGIPERRLCPYEGETMEEYEYGPRVKRMWSDLGAGLSRMVVMILNRIARGELPAPEAGGTPGKDEVPMIIVRGDDGAVRIIPMNGKGALAVGLFLETVARFYRQSGEKERLWHIREEYEKLQGKNPESGNYWDHAGFGIRGIRFAW